MVKKKSVCLSDLKMAGVAGQHVREWPCSQSGAFLWMGYRELFSVTTAFTVKCRVSVLGGSVQIGRRGLGPGAVCAHSEGRLVSFRRHPGGAQRLPAQPPRALGSPVCSSGMLAFSPWVWEPSTPSLTGQDCSGSLSSLRCPFWPLGVRRPQQALGRVGGDPGSRGREGAHRAAPA